MSKNPDPKKVLVGFSGGVDSTASCILLREKGYDVVGYFFDVTGSNISARKEAEVSANQLGIDLITEDVSEEFDREVIANFCTEYISGRTPNPCIICNPKIKFAKLVETADRIGAKFIATGHYARLKEIDGHTYIRRALNEKKDQSYMLYRLPESILKRLIFPLGDIPDKADVRLIAKKEGLANSNKKDSQEICFIDPSDNYHDYIRRRGYENARGKFIDREGNVLGEHEGILNYTIGQRKGLKIALGKPAFVVSMNAEDNTVTLGDNEDLFSKTVRSTSNVFTDGSPEKYLGREITAKIRYSSKPERAVISSIGDVVVTEFIEPQRAVTQGQSIVFYDNEIVIGGGFML